MNSSTLAIDERDSRQDTIEFINSSTALITQLAQLPPGILPMPFIEELLSMAASSFPAGRKLKDEIAMLSQNWDAVQNLQGQLQQSGQQVQQLQAQMQELQRNNQAMQFELALDRDWET